MKYSSEVGVIRVGLINRSHLAQVCVLCERCREQVTNDRLKSTTSSGVCARSRSSNAIES